MKVIMNSWFILCTDIQAVHKSRPMNDCEIKYVILNLSYLDDRSKDAVSDARFLFPIGLAAV